MNYNKIDEFKSKAQSTGEVFPGIYLCEILFDDICHFDDLIKDKDIIVIWYREVFPNGIHDRKERSLKIINNPDTRSYHKPCKRIIFLTSNKELCQNIHRSIGIQYMNHIWFEHTYETIQAAKILRPRRFWWYCFRSQCVTNPDCIKFIEEWPMSDTYWFDMFNIAEDEDANEEESYSLDDERIKNWKIVI